MEVILFLSTERLMYSINFWISSPVWSYLRRASAGLCICFSIEIRSWFQSHSSRWGQGKRQSIPLQANNTEVSEIG